MSIFLAKNLLVSNSASQSLNSEDPRSISPTTSSYKNESYTISNGYCRKNLTIINEENLEWGDDLNKIYLQSFSSSTNLSGYDKISEDTKATSASTEYLHNIEEYDSDESLGLLPDLLKDFTSDSFILNDELDKNPITAENTSFKHIEQLSGCLNHELKYGDKELTISPICKASVSSSQTESPLYYNRSTPKSSSTPKNIKSYPNAIDDKIVSPQDMNNFSLNEKISNSEEMKGVVEEEKDLEYSLNKTCVIEPFLNPVSTNMPAICSKSENIYSEKNILNTTVNMSKTFDTDEISLNKTFEILDSLADQCTLPATSHTKPYQISKLDIPNKNFDHYLSEFDPNSDKENVLNITCDLVKESDAIKTVCENFSDNSKSCIRDVLNITLPHPCVLEQTQIIFSSSENKYNIEQNIVHDGTGDILNTTYEKVDEFLKYDTNSETLKCITNLKENKKPPHDTKTIAKKRRTLSFSAKNVDARKIEFKNKDVKFDRFKNARRSFGSFGKNVERTDSIRQTFRRSLHNNICDLSKVHEVGEALPSSKGLVPRWVENTDSKGFLSKENKFVDIDPSYLTTKSKECVPLKFSDTKSNDIKCVSKIKLNSSEEPLLNEAINLHPNISDVDKIVKCSPKSNFEGENRKSASKIKLKDSKESLLNETINVSPPITNATKTVIKKPRDSNTLLNTTMTLPITDTTKTVIKKPRNSMQINFKGSCLYPCELPLAKNIESNSNTLLNTTMTLPETDTAKTVIKKPRNSMQINLKENCLHPCELPLAKYIKSNSNTSLNTTISVTLPETDTTKTVIKKPRNSMQINLKDNCLYPCKLPLAKNIKSDSNTSLNTTINMTLPETDATKTAIKKSNDSNTSLNTTITLPITDATKTDIKKSNDSNTSFNTTITLPITDATKTVIKKPRDSNVLLDMTSSMTLPVTDATKTIIKKPRNSMQIYPKDNCLYPHELPLSKTTKSAIPSFHKRSSMKISHTREDKLTLGFNENKNFTLSKNTGLKEPVSMEKKISRLPQKTLSQMKFQSDSHLSNTKESSNIAKPLSSIPGVKLQAASKKSLSQSRKPLNPKSELAGKAILTDFGICQNNKSTETFKKFQSSSKIPSAPCFQKRKN